MCAVINLYHTHSISTLVGVKHSVLLMIGLWFFGSSSYVYFPHALLSQGHQSVQFVPNRKLNSREFSRCVAMYQAMRGASIATPTPALTVCRRLKHFYSWCYPNYKFYIPISCIIFSIICKLKKADANSFCVHLYKPTLFQPQYDWMNAALGNVIWYYVLPYIILQLRDRYYQPSILKYNSRLCQMEPRYTKVHS